ncbi:MAG: tetratricopeptide repeat protein [Candidatus Omnitrophota bacterium]
MYRQKTVFLIILLLFAASFVCYSNMLHADFVWDDEFLVVRNSLIRVPLWSFQFFKQDILNTGFTHSLYYRPVQILSYAIDYRLWGLNPFGFHLSNIILHFINGVLLFFLVFKLTRSEFTAFFSSLFFIIHPIQTGAVSYVSGRGELLFFLFGFLYMRLYLCFKDKKNYFLFVLSLFFLTLSFLCKEAAIIFPVLLFLIGRLFLKEKKLRAMKFQAPGFILAGLYVIARYFFGHGQLRFLKGIDIKEVLFKYFIMVKELWGLILYPGDLHMRRELIFNNIYTIIFFCFFLFSGIVFYRQKKERNILLFSFIFYLTGLVPFVFSFGSFNVFAEHWAYLPGCGIFLFIAFEISKMLEKNRRFYKIFAATGIFFIVFLSALSTREYNEFWKDDSSLSNRILSFSDQDDSAMYYRILSARDSGKKDEVFERMREYAESYPDDPAVWYIKGRNTLAMGDVDAAEKDFEKVFNIAPGYVEGYMGLALIEFARGRNSEGICYLEKLVSVNSKNSEALLRLGTAYYSEGKTEEAFKAMRKAGEINAYDYNYLVNMGSLRAREGELQEAIKLFLRAIKIYPNVPLVHYNMGEVFRSVGEKKEAKKWFQKTIMIDANFSPAIQALQEMANSE